MNRFLASIIFIISFCSGASGQIPVGAWRDHLSYNRATHVAVGEDKVYCATGSGMIVYNKYDNSLEKLSKVNGLSDAGISSIEWSAEGLLLIVGYDNGNLDIIRNNKITNLSDVLRSSVLGSKSINNIMVVENKAYLSCAFGIVVVNLDRDEISETIFLGEGGINLTVYDMAFDGDYLYAATSSGIYKAAIDATNLLDFSYWSQLGFLPDAGALFYSLTWFDDKLYAVQMSQTGDYVVYQIENGSWTYFTEPSKSRLGLSASEDYLAVISESESDIYGPGPSFIKKIDDYGLWDLAIRHVMVDNGNVWIADNIHGLVRNSGNNFDILTPSGPFSNDVFSVQAYPERAYIAAGGYTLASVNLWKNGEFSAFRNGSWSSILNYDIRDVLYVEEHPQDPERQFLATWGYGIVEYRRGNLHKRFGENNSTLQSIIPGDNYTRIGGMAFDADHNLWVTNTGVPDPVSVMKANGEWLSFPYGELINHDHVGKLIITSLGHKWVLLPRGGGLFVFQNSRNPGNSSEDRTRRLSITDENKRVISNDVFSIAEDKNNYIWVGTNNGVVVYYSPSRVFSEDHFYARRIVVSGDRDEELGYLLNNETVTSIAVDGANRKWLGTEKSGVFLVSADGKQQIHNFTRQNSPLLTNNIIDIAIDPAKGEVFFGTSGGVVSFRGDATASAGRFSNVYTFPNPVRENYQGPVTITGLVKDTVVKITDISGNLVYETVSLGGQAVWDGLNSRGERARTGIYLIFLSAEDGTETHVSKLMFIH